MATNRIDSVHSLHPKFAFIVNRLHKNLIRLHQAGSLQFRFEIFETFRHPDRQTSLKAEGVSKSMAWRSAHNYGLACDFVPYLSQAEGKALGVTPGWYWPKITDPCWKILKQEALNAGAIGPIDWDGPHVESLIWRTIKPFVT